MFIHERNHQKNVNAPAKLHPKAIDMRSALQSCGVYFLDKQFFLSTQNRSSGQVTFPSLFGDCGANATAIALIAYTRN